MRWRKSERDDLLPGVSEKQFFRAAREYSAAAYPNPGRTGCPDHSRLAALARRKVRLEAELEVIEHVATCSPCFVEFREIHKAWKQKRTGVMVAAVAALVCLAAIFGINLVNHHRADRPGVAKAPPQQPHVELQKMAIDLRPYEPVRGNDPRRHEPGPIALPPANLELTMQLPVGSEKGRYIIQLLDQNGILRMETHGDAVFLNYITTLVASADLRSVTRGRFTLLVRREPSPGALSCPVEVR